MYEVSNEFKEKCKASVGTYKIAKLYVVEDNMTITGDDYLQSFSIEDNCYVNDRFIGTTVAKKISIEILNPNNEIDLENKTIDVQVGVTLDDETIEYIPMGTFIIEQSKDENVKKKLKFTGYDYMVKFNKTYEDSYVYPVSLYNYLKSLCQQVGVELANEEIVNGDFQVTGNVFTNREDCKTVLSNIVQLCGGFAKIGRDNRLYICNLKTSYNSTSIELSIDGDEYFTDFEMSNEFGEVNELILNMSNVEGENVTRKDTVSIEVNGLTELIISDNYFLSSEELRNSVIDAIWEQVIYLKYLPFKTKYYGYPFLDTGDLIEIKDINDNAYYTYIFNHTITYNGVFRGEFETKALTKTQTAYKNSGLREKFRNTQIIVDKQNQLITNTIERQNDLQSEIVEQKNILEQTIESTTNTIERINNDLTEQLSELKQTVDGLTQKVSDTGGNNIFYYAKEFWNNETDDEEGNLEEYTDTEIQQMSVSGEGYIINEGTSRQTTNVQNNTYTISFMYRKVTPLATGYIIINNERYDLTNENWTEFNQTIDIDTNTIDFQIYSDTNGAFKIFDLMGNIGSEKEIWTQNPNETRTDTVTIGKGIQVNSNSRNTYTRIDADGNRVYSTNTNEVIAEFTDKGMSANEIKANAGEIGGVLIQKIDEQTWFSSLL